LQHQCNDFIYLRRQIPDVKTLEGGGNMIIYHDRREIIIVYFYLKSSIFFKVAGLWTSGRSPHPHSSEKSPSQNCTFQPVINKKSEKVHPFLSAPVT
jgi:hypothetical protein